MDDRVLRSKPKIAVLAAFIYTAVMGGAMFYMRAVQGITYGDPKMMTVFWLVLLGLNLLNVFWVTRYFGWQAIGFRPLNRQQLLWFLPSIAVLMAMWVVCLSGLSRAALSAAQWQLFAIAGFTTLLVGLGEETMYRGIVLHSFLTTGRVRWAMLVSAIGFALLHAVNVFGGVPLLGMPMQLIMTFLFGLFFAPLMLKLNNIVPLLIFHWLWDFVLFAAPLMGEQVHASVGIIGMLNIPIEIIGGIWLWLQLKQVPDRAIANFPDSLLDGSISDKV
ncbi:CPBP family intramembrane glutamic endopeptidase [Pantanalinema sp. GBBB05]|uniref:CPBP family intramembrane glutamic endopeptidase n=1 Tax=Pantanalinema sp. GBBB05 TaxID=2604139 RepID=UPI001DF0C666|nr:CPBP family intramembrane metalloprotease [Pantanalinema sp. GBBB05]